MAVQLVRPIGGTQSKRGCCPRTQHSVRSNSNASVFSQQVLQTITSLHKLLSALQVGLALHPAPTHCLPELPVVLCPLSPLLLSRPCMAGHPMAGLQAVEMNCCLREPVLA